MLSVRVIALLAPGQGSQKAGMLSDWLTDPEVAHSITALGESIGVDLSSLGTEADADTITDTSVAQPLIVAASILSFRALTEGQQLPTDAIVAGHSVGELAAAAIAGVLSEDDAIRLASVRGIEMAKACNAEATGMTALLGGEETEVLTRLEQLSLVPANRNAAGQIVAAGRRADLDKLAAHPPERARIRPLPVAGAFHSSFMASARDAFAAAANTVTWNDPQRTLLSNVDGQPVSSGEDCKAKLINQVVSPVRWDLCTAFMKDRSVGAVVELSPAGALVGIARRELKGTPNYQVNSPEDARRTRSALYDLNDQH